MKKTPWLVTILGYLLIINAVLDLVLVFGASQGLNDPDPNFEFYRRAMFANNLLVGGIGFGLLAGKNWARWAFVTMAVASTGLVLVYKPNSFLWQAGINGIIIAVLFVNQKCRAFFEPSH